ncbi:hypothetical protein SAMN05216406_1602 [Nitrosomonas ureae]|uniref:Uncharacterized protein n=1 Tax=Nitrosomonas ureae TaxID=44577 RepID=A0A1H2HQX2_9PROT|nr:hypothetical protein ATY38_10740 [Nitrosomonas ureae]SDU34247.1 hypothetical protein SAMN05216406_1602 [Nitrosomonas ureae]
MTSNLSDNVLKSQIKSFKDIIEGLAKKHELWYDSGFTTWLERYEDEPYENPCVLILHFKGSIQTFLTDALLNVKLQFVRY